MVSPPDGLAVSLVVPALSAVARFFGRPARKFVLYSYDTDRVEVGTQGRHGSVRGICGTESGGAGVCGGGICDGGTTILPI